MTSSRFAASSSAEVASRTAPTLPGAASADRQGLDRIDHAGVGALGLERGQDRLQRGLGQHRHVQGRLAEPLGPPPHLGRRLLSGDVERLAAGGGEIGQGHPRDRALADPGGAPEQDQRPGDQPAPEHPVELRDPGGQARGALGADLAQRRRAGSVSPRPGSPARPGGRRRHLLQGVPGAAAGALPRPGQRLPPALGAPERSPRLRHPTIVWTAPDGSVVDSKQRAPNR